MSTEIPSVPPRPYRTQNNSSNSLGTDLPNLPARPIKNRPERSISPHQESYAQSPLNEAPSNQKIHDKPSIDACELNELRRTEICRPSSVNLPSVGQEGIEYAEAYVDPGHELKKLSTPASDASSDEKIQELGPNFSNSNQKESDSTMNCGKFSENSEKSDITSQNLSGTERRLSNVSNEHGIPQIGQIVPMYPNAGDVQAPSPSLAVSSTTGSTSNDDGTQPRHHGRKLSGRAYDIPSDAYLNILIGRSSGRYGHGIISHDRFDKAYYKKHPELFKKEFGSYGEGKPEWALSSEDLNKIVRDTAKHGAGVGASSASFGTPSEQIGFKASEEYASRISSPRSYSSYQIAHSNTSEAKIDDSPGLKSSISSNLPLKHIEPNQVERNIEIGIKSGHDVIHVDDQLRRDIDAQRDTEHTGALDNFKRASSDGKIQDDHGYGAPILAPDEVDKEPFGWELQPAVSLLDENTKNSQESTYSLKSDSQATSIENRSLNRSGTSVNKIPNFSLSPSIPLENLDEYEPLFPEEDEISSPDQKSINSTEKIKCPEINRKFPSQDVWEDTPKSLQYTATVSAPQLPEDKKEKEKIDHETETPAQAFARRQEELAEQEMKDPETFPQQEKAKKKMTACHQPELQIRPKLSNQRFPSRDIWEVPPDSLLLQTTVTGPQTQRENVNNTLEQHSSPSTELSQYKNFVKPPPDQGGEIISAGPQPTPEPMSLPDPINSISGTLQQSKSAKSDISIKSLNLPACVSDGSLSAVPLKPKPQVPTRPSRSVSREPSDNSPSQTVFNQAVTPKTKPPIPSKSAVGKIAALQSGFMSDLNKRLQQGPPTSKKDVTNIEQQPDEKENITLVDVRRGRARGPARRAPVKAPMFTPTSGVLNEELSPLKLSQTSTIWTIDPDIESLHVLSHNSDN